MDEDYEDVKFYRSYLLGPFTLEEWLNKSTEAEQIFTVFQETHPDLEVKRQTMIEKEPNCLMILISIANR